MKEVGVVRGVPLGAEYDPETELVGLLFVLTSGDHLHVQVTPQQLETLSRHIAAVSSQLPVRKPRQTET